MSREDFFTTPEPQSRIKTELVTKYFEAWADVILPRASGSIAYVDLFSGPGKFEDGSDSTPLRILNHAKEDEALSRRLVTIFNDMNPEYSNRLQAATNALPGIGKMVIPPQIMNIEVGTELVDVLRVASEMPTLFFIDPWGYKGLSLDLIGGAIRNWGCDCIFFFNYNRINAGLDNAIVADHMRQLFGVERFERLRAEVNRLSPRERERAIMSAMTESLKEVGGRYVLPFGIKNQHGTRTSHYIIFVSKHFRGYHIMKEVMIGLSTNEGEIGSFEYLPVRSPQLRLLDFDNPHSISTLKEILLRQFAGRSMSVAQTYEASTVDTPYTLRNVKRSIAELEAEGRVVVDPPADKRPKRKGAVTLADDKIVTFPATKGRPDVAEFDD
jgi:three-Cys-motif partner protein